MKTLYLAIITTLSITIIMNTGITYAQGGPAMMDQSSYLSQISASGNNVYLMWSDYNPNDKVYHALFRASNDEGKSFGHLIGIGDSSSGSDLSQMTSQNNNLYIPLGNVIKKSSDGGHTFNDIIPIKNYTGNISISNIVATENNVYLTIDHAINSGNGFEILFAASTDNGTTFGKPLKLWGMPESSQDYSQIVASGTNVYAVGEGKDGGIQGSIGVLYRASRDGGTTFSNIVDLSGDNSIDYAPKIATDGTNVYVTWSELASDKKNSDLIFRVSTDGGETFGPRIKLNQDNNSSDTYNTDFVQLLAHDQIAYVKWWDVHFSSNGTESDHLLFKRMPGGDAMIGKTIELTGNNARPTDIGHNSVIVYDENNLYALWSENPNHDTSQLSVFLRASTDGGFSFGDEIELNKQNNLAGRGIADVQIATYENNVYVAGDIASTATGILFGSSTDNGKTFGVFTDLDAEAVPEFPFTSIILLTSISSMIIFYRMIFRK